MINGIRMHPRDNVAVCLDNVNPGDVIELADCTIEGLDEILPFHKIAIVDISKEDKVYKYGEIIGVAVADIKVGQHVHEHNIVTLRSEWSEKIEKETLGF